MSLATFISRIRGLEGFAFDVAKEAAPLVQEAQRANMRAGLTPDGDRWQPKKDGGAPLKNSAEHLTAAPAGDAVVMTLTGPEVFHNDGTKTLPKRQILPSAGKLPKYLVDALNEGARRAFAKGGSR